MPRLANTTNAQSVFLRAFRTSTTGPAPDAWPAPAILRRWLRRPAFATALRSLRDTLRHQVDFHLATAAAQAVQRLASQPQLDPADLRRLSELLRLAHQRQRFPAKVRLASPATFALRDEIDELEKDLQNLREKREHQRRHPDDPQDQHDDLDDDEQEDEDNDDDDEDDPTVQDQLDAQFEAEANQRLGELRARANPTPRPAPTRKDP